MRLYTIIIATLPLIAASQAGVADDLSLEYFAKHPDYDTVKLAPDGDHVAATVEQEGRRVLAIVDKEGLDLTGGARPQLGASVSTFRWVNDDRVVYTITEDPPWLDFPTSTGELYGVNADGSGHGAIFGYRARDRSGRGASAIRRTVENTRASHRIVDILPDDENEILITKHPWAAEQGKWVVNTYAHPDAMRLNVEDGRMRKVDTLPVPGAQALTDREHNLRFSVGVDKQAALKVAWMPEPGGEWESLTVPDLRGEDVTPVGYDQEDDTMLLFAAADAKGPYGLYRYDPNENESSEVYRHDYANVNGIVRDMETDEMVALRIEPGKPDYKYFANLDNKTVNLHASLRQAFEGKDVWITSHTEDTSEAIAFVSSDRDPGSYYLFDADNMKATFLFSRRSWVEPEEMRPREPISLEARDGMKLHGYLTRPGSDGPHPIIVMPHGGPHGIRDDWGFDWRAQLLANRGYAVLQVNYRGSGGYGPGFESAGHGEWGAKMQDDLTDATRWAVEQDVTERGSICIFGGSYGGYAALMGAAKEPELYQCAVGQAGVYDLELMFEEGDIPSKRYGIGYLETVLGDDKAKLRKRSPVHRAADIEAAIMLAHGGEDRRVPIEHAERMRDALKEAGNPARWIEYPEEGHGFYDVDHRVEFYRELLDFLDEHI